MSYRGSVTSKTELSEPAVMVILLLGIVMMGPNSATMVGAGLRLT